MPLSFYAYTPVRAHNHKQSKHAAPRRTIWHTGAQMCRVRRHHLAYYKSGFSNPSASMKACSTASGGE